MRCDAPPASGWRRSGRGRRRERLRSVLVAAVPSALILGMGVVPGPAQADGLQPPYPFRAGPCVERTDEGDADGEDGSDGAAADGPPGEDAPSAGEGREPPADSPPPELDDGAPQDATAPVADDPAPGTGGPPAERGPGADADAEDTPAAPDDARRGAARPDDRGGPPPDATDTPPEGPGSAGPGVVEPAPGETSPPGAPEGPPPAGDAARPGSPPDPLGLGEGLRDLTDAIGRILFPGTTDRDADENRHGNGTGNGTGDGTEDRAAGADAAGTGGGAPPAAAPAQGEQTAGGPNGAAGDHAAGADAGRSGHGVAAEPGGEAGGSVADSATGGPGEEATGGGAAAEAPEEADQEEADTEDGPDPGEGEQPTPDPDPDADTDGIEGDPDDAAPEAAPEADDPFAPDAAGRVPYPCPEERDVPGIDEETVQVLPDAPWLLEASHMTLRGLEYHGVVNVRTSGGAVKQALKFTAAALDIGDLHQVVRGTGGLTYHVQAADGSTSTFREGTVTMYTERLEGNLFGLIPVVFDPRHEPLLDLREAYFTDVRVTQAGQFGGTLTVPGMRQYMTHRD
ncbi:hypothetical protein [Streptomyces spiramenti]|uniref:Hydrogenase expression protein HypF n=1 Tax=Streptomyces spiramenti TaxID=2720606 RepID=A0ABX1ANK5_9ACTN|nr:hypothetical protein [Streptomyces spiramenti]